MGWPGARYRSKPPTGRGVRWGHRLARGLSLYFPLSEGGGSAVDLVIGATATPQSPNVGWRGEGAWFPSLTGADSLATPYDPRFSLANQAFSHATFFRQVDKGNTQYATLINQGGVAANGQVLYWLVTSNTLYRWTGWITSLQVTYGVPYLLVTSFVPVAGGGANESAYLLDLNSGKWQVGAQATTAGAVPPAIAGPLGIGGVPGTTPTHPFQGEIGQSFLWIGRALDRNDAEELAEDPFCLIERPANRRFLSFTRPVGDSDILELGELAGVAAGAPAGDVGAVAELGGVGLGGLDQAELGELAAVGIVAVDPAGLLEGIGQGAAVGGLDLAGLGEVLGATAAIGSTDAAAAADRTFLENGRGGPLITGGLRRRGGLVTGGFGGGLTARTAADVGSVGELAALGFAAADAAAFEELLELDEGAVRLVIAEDLGELTEQAGGINRNLPTYYWSRLAAVDPDPEWTQIKRL